MQSHRRARARARTALLFTAIAVTLLVVATAEAVTVNVGPCTVGNQTQYASGALAVRTTCTQSGSKFAAVEATPGTNLIRPSAASGVAANVSFGLRIKPNARGLTLLRRNGRLKVRVRYTFTDNNGSETSTIQSYTLRVPTP